MPKKALVNNTLNCRLLELKSFSCFYKYKYKLLINKNGLFVCLGNAKYRNSLSKNFAFINKSIIFAGSKKYKN